MLLLCKHTTFNIKRFTFLSTAKIQARRQATEDRILDAFENVLIAKGVRNLTLTAIAAEANVGKPLLYRYFGSLPDLVKAWGERRGAFLDPYPPEGPGEERFDDLKDLLEFDLLRTADYFRSNPVTLEFLAEELVGTSDISKAFNALRGQTRKASVKRLMQNVRYLDDDNRSLILILFAAISYLALRSRHTPKYFDVDLSTQKGWDEIERLMKVIIDNARQISTDA